MVAVAGGGYPPPPLTLYQGGEVLPLEGLTGSPDRLAATLRGFKASSESMTGRVPERATTFTAHTLLPLQPGHVADALSQSDLE